MTNKTTKRALLSSVLALFLCFTMLLGTTYAWFTDEVTSAGNVIQTGSLKVGFQYANGVADPANAAWNNVNGAIFDYENWEPGYTVAKYLKVTNDGTLALNYKLRIVADGVVSKLADVIDVYVLDGAVSTDNRNVLTENNYVGTLTQVLLANGANDALNDADKGVAISEIIKGSLAANADQADVYTLVLKMKEDADNKYQNMDLGCTFSVQLLATQMSAESDSFDKEYDAVVPNEEIPAALVRPLENRNIIYTVNGWDNGTEVNKTLDVAYSFQPTEDEIDLSFYQHWMADYVVSADKDVPANSIALAGYYSVMCDNFNNGNWVALTHDGVITAGTEIPLVESMGWPVHYSDIVEFGTDGIGFRCGAVDLTGQNAGTTLTVELRIYETEAKWDDSSASSVKTGRYITIGKFTYTFTATVGTQAELKDALANGANLIDAQGANLGTFSYLLNTTNVPAGETVVIKNATVDGWNYGNAVAGTVVFENCKFTSDSAYSIHFDAGNGNVVFNNCELEGWCAFGSAIQSVTLNNCKISGNGIYSIVRCYQDVTMTNCVIDASNTNTTDRYQDGIDVTAGCTATMINCTNVNGTVADLFEAEDIAGTDGKVVIQ